MTDPAEALAQQVTERVLDLVVSALDINELAARVDPNVILSRVDVSALLDRVDVGALLDRVDVGALLDRVDVNALLDRVEVNDLLRRVDIDALVQDTDLGVLMARSTGGVASDVLDAARSQAVRLDLLVDRWVCRVLRRKQAGPSAPPALLPPRAAVTSVQGAT
jgi:hypothetical protein